MADMPILSPREHLTVIVYDTEDRVRTERADILRAQRDARRDRNAILIKDAATRSQLYRFADEANMSVALIDLRTSPEEFEAPGTQLIREIRHDERLATKCRPAAWTAYGSADIADHIRVECGGFAVIEDDWVRRGDPALLDVVVEISGRPAHPAPFRVKFSRHTTTLTNAAEENEDRADTFNNELGITQTPGSTLSYGDWLLLRGMATGDNSHELASRLNRKAKGTSKRMHELYAQARSMGHATNYQLRQIIGRSHPPAPQRPAIADRPDPWQAAVWFKHRDIYRQARLTTNERVSLEDYFAILPERAESQAGRPRGDRMLRVHEDLDKRVATRLSGSHITPAIEAKVSVDITHGLLRLQAAAADVRRAQTQPR